MSPQALNATQTAPDVTALTAPRGADRAAVEIPTLLLVVATYTGWLAATYAYGHLPLVLVLPLVVALLTLHSSLQHEILHGHPTRWVWFNRLLAIAPLSLWQPYERYHQLHRIHHIDARLTDPIDDPESFYWTAGDWARLPPGTRASLRLQQTLAGRVLIGSFWRIGMFLHSEWPVLVEGRGDARRLWVEHLLWCVPVLAWVKLVCGIPLWLYVVGMVIPANGLLQIRAFAEHRARPGVPERIATVESSWILGPLFLFNNLHLLHHENTRIPWYELSRVYRRERTRLLAASDHLVYVTYFDVARRFLFRPHDVLQHPTDRVPNVAA